MSAKGQGVLNFSKQQFTASISCLPLLQVMKIVSECDTTRKENPKRTGALLFWFRQLKLKANEIMMTVNWRQQQWGDSCDVGFRFGCWESRTLTQSSQAPYLSYTRPGEITCPEVYGVIWQRASCRRKFPWSGCRSCTFSSLNQLSPSVLYQACCTSPTWGNPEHLFPYRANIDTIFFEQSQPNIQLAAHGPRQQTGTASTTNQM